jgi:hypothetical protein
VRRDLAVGLSLATLWFIGVWSDLLPFLYISDRFPIGALPCWNDFAAVVINVVLLGSAFAAAARLARRGPRWVVVLAQWALLGSLAVPANALRNHFNTPPERLYALLGPTIGLAVFGAMALLLLVVAVRWRTRIVAVVTAALNIMFPLVLITFGQAAWAIAQAGGRMQCGGTTGRAKALAGSAARRVLWIVYDEMDQRTVFDERPRDLRLPKFDRLRAESLAASSALPPADRTERSMPAFLSGLRVADARLVGRNQLRLEVAGRAEPLVWTGADTIFARARTLGVNTGLAGFFLPYCAMIGDSLTICQWQPCVTCGRLTGVFGNSLGESMWHQASELAPQYGRRRHLDAFKTLQEAGVALARDPSIGFALLHLPVPHEPGIYDRARDDFSIRAAAGDGYAHNLALADRSLGELRSAIDSAGLSDKTTVMVFGDHGRRSHADGESIADPRVPFLVRMAGQSQGMTYRAPVDLLRVHDLTLEILSGRVSTPNDLHGWLDGHR